MRMIYCVRTTMVTSLSVNTTVTATATNRPLLENNINLIRSEPGISANEARRLPEVTDEDASALIDNNPSPTVDAWKATIKDHKVIRLNTLFS